MMMLYQKEIDSLYESFERNTFKRKANLSDLKMSLAVALPRVDYYLSHKALVNRDDYLSLAASKFNGGLFEIIKDYYHRGRLNRFGYVADTSSYICSFNNIGVDYFWMPKNACTNYKKVFSIKNDPSFLEEVDKSQFHEKMQRKYGLGMKEYLERSRSDNEKITFSIYRDPIERFVSCYIDKFVKPIVEERKLESFIENITENYYKKVGINEGANSRSLTFSEFLFMVINTPAFSLNEHWRPQENFVSGYEFDFFIKQEAAEDWAVENGFIEEQKRGGKENSSIGKTYTPDLYFGDLESVLPKDIILSNVKDYSQFVSPIAKLLLEDFYKYDYEMIARREINV